MSACYTQLQASELVVPEFLALNTISSLFQPWQTELRCQQRISIIKELVFGLTTLVLVWKGAVAEGYTVCYSQNQWTELQP